MDDIHDIRDPVAGNTTLLYVAAVILIGIILLGVTAYVYYYLDRKYKRRFKNLLKKLFEKKRDYRADAIHSLQRLAEKVQNQTIAMKQTYLDLSEILRWYVEMTQRNKALTKTKTELTYLQKKELDALLDTYYERVFREHTAVGTDQVLGDINRAKQFIQTWN